MESDKDQIQQLSNLLRTSHDVDDCLNAIHNIGDDSWFDAWDHIEKDNDLWRLTPAAMVALVRYYIDTGCLEDAYYMTNDIVRRLMMWQDEPWPAEGIDMERWGVENSPPADMSGIYACIYMTHFKVMSAGEDYIRKRNEQVG